MSRFSNLHECILICNVLLSHKFFQPLPLSIKKSSLTSSPPRSSKLSQNFISNILLNSSTSSYFLIMLLKVEPKFALDRNALNGVYFEMARIFLCFSFLMIVESFLSTCLSHPTSLLFVFGFLLVYLC